MTWQILEGDAIERLRDLDAESVQTCVTSPPYWGLRDYGTASWEGGNSECNHRQETPVQSDATSTLGVPADGGPRRIGEDNATVVGKGVYRDTCGKCGAKRIDSQLGLEPTPEQYVANLVAVFREVRRVLREDGTVWLNLGDSYNAHPGTRGRDSMNNLDSFGGYKKGHGLGRVKSLKPKDLCGIPWRVAFALQADGWWLRSDIIWNKPNPMPESVTDRPTRAHEYIFLLTKSARYFYDADAIREEGQDWSSGGPGVGIEPTFHYGAENGGNEGLSGIAARYKDGTQAAGRNKRSVWTVTTQPYAEAHFATFPPKLIEPCILAGSPPKCCGECGAPWRKIIEATGELIKQQNGGPGTVRAHVEAKGPHGATSSLTTGYSQEREVTGVEPTCDHDDDSGRSVVLDPFAGSGTTGLVALRHDRSFVGIELSADYCALARNRIRDDAPLFNTPLEVGGEPSGYGTPTVVTDKQSGHGRRHAGFNERWKNREAP